MLKRHIPNVSQTQQTQEMQTDGNDATQNVDKEQLTHNENQRAPSLQTEQKKERSYPTKQVTYRPTDKTIRSVLSTNRTKKKGIAKQERKQKVSQAETITPTQMRNAQNSMNNTAISSYQPMSSALRYALLRSNKRYKPGD